MTVKVHIKRLFEICDSRTFRLRPMLFTSTSVAIGTTMPSSAGAKINRPETKNCFGRKIQITSRLFVNLAISAVCFAAGIQSVYAQSGKVVLPLREVTVKQAMAELQRQTDNKVAVNWDDIDPERKIFLPSQEMNVSELLRTSLSGTGFTWEIHGNHIIITQEAVEEKAAPDDGRGAQSAMTVRESFPEASITFVPDPCSKTQKPFEDMFNVRKSYWNNDGDGEDSLGMVVINYRVSSATVERDYMDNARMLDIIHKSLTSKEVLAGLDYIIVTSGSSPEGNTKANEKLAAQRSMAMKAYLMRKYPYLDKDIIYTFSIGEDWSGLRSMVEKDLNTPCRDQVLEKLDAQISSNAKRAALRSIGGGKAYNYIASKMLPKLRGATAATLHFKEKDVRIVETRITDTVYVEKTIEKERIVMQEPELEPHPLFALKTNLLFDAALAINVELEIPIGKRWSVAGEWVFPWWLYNGKQYAMQVGNGNLEVKYWFGNRNGRRQLTGWFAGIYGGGGYYDLEWETKGWQGEFWHAGIGGGYAHTISRSGNWRMEYMLGVGYMGNNYREYIPKMGDDGSWHLVRRGVGRSEWFGPTRAKVSLVWMLNHGQRRKGGMR